MAETSLNPNYDIVFVLGGPGTGKGTVCTQLSKEFSMPHLSMGDLLRAEVASGSDLGKEIARIIDGGNVVPARIAVTLLLQAIQKAREAEGIRGVLIDGFPRSQEQVDAWRDQMGSVGFVIYLACDDNEMLIQRILSRGGSRADDQEATIRKRLEVNVIQCEPCVEVYRKQGLVKDINAKLSIEQNYAIAQKMMTEHFQKHNL